MIAFSNATFCRLGETAQNPICISSRSNAQVTMNSLPPQSTPLKTIATLTLLLFLLPFNCLVVLAAWFWTTINRPSQKITVPISDRKTVMLTGGKMTKALQLARSFTTVGHRIVLVETEKYWLTGHRFSNAVDRFYTVPAPEKDSQKYIDSLLQIAKQEQVDIYVPVCSPVSSYYDSLVKPVLSGCCEVLHLDAAMTQLLDDKFAFAEQSRSLGLSVPKSVQITNPQQVLDFDFNHESRPHILKSIPYDSVRRLDLTQLPCDLDQMETFVHSLPISAAKPWIMQEFITGQEYCTHSTVRDGEIRLHCCCKSSAFQVNYENVEHPQIQAWIQHFVRELKLTGQVSFDFIEADDGTAYAIECNPRTHSAITMFYNHPDVAEAYLGQTPLPQPIQPLLTSKPTYWLYHELWRLVTTRSLTQLQTRLAILRQGKDAIFQVNDPLPFLAVHHWQIPLLLLDNLRRGGGWTRIDFNIGKLIELGGD